MRRLPHGRHGRQPQRAPITRSTRTSSRAQGCHATATTFDVNGFQSQVQAALTQIETWFNAQGLLDARAAPRPTRRSRRRSSATATGTRISPCPAPRIDGALLTQDQAGALYNYILVARGGAYGVHNPKYIAQILYDSYYALTGRPARGVSAAPAVSRA